MFQSIGHIKNPLTVIAIFSSVAEMSGAAALPWLDKEIQVLYVLFLIGFPCLLVLLFFCTLWFKCKVLYAPSDYRKDKSFTDMFKPQRLADDTDTDFEPTTEACDEYSRDMPENLPNVFSEKNHDSEDGDAPIDPSKAITANYAKNTLRIQALNRLGSEFGSNFMIDVTPSKHPNKKFDFVMESSFATCVAKVFYSLSKIDTLNEFQLRRSFEDTYLLWEELDHECRDKFVFTVIVIGENLTQARKTKIQSQIRYIAHKFPFQVIPKIWGPQDLSGQPLT